MEAKTLSRLRPADESPSAIRGSLVNISAEKSTTEARMAEAVKHRNGLLLEGSTSEIRAAETAIRDAETDIMQLNALADALAPKLEMALDAEHEAAQSVRREDAATAIQKWNEWLSTHYQKHAAAIAEGLKIEAEALSAIERLKAGVRRDKLPAVLPPPLPAMARLFVGTEGRPAHVLVRLPALDLGETPIAWG